MHPRSPDLTLHLTSVHSSHTARVRSRGSNYLQALFLSSGINIARGAINIFNASISPDRKATIAMATDRSPDQAAAGGSGSDHRGRNTSTNRRGTIDLRAALLAPRSLSVADATRGAHRPPSNLRVLTPQIAPPRHGNRL
ncbi:hypothetical protein VTK26DRAFT_377 [Humicola hyalothermophila]